MKSTIRALIIVAGLFCVLPSKANATNLEWLGIVTGFGGGERETGMDKSQTEFRLLSGPPGPWVSSHQSQPLGKATGFGGVHALGLIPIGPFGFQGTFQYMNASGSRFSTTFGPIWDFTAGKVGFFGSFQHRTIFDQGGSTRSRNFWWIEPALDWYLPNINLSLRYIQPVSSVQEKTTESDKADNNQCCEIGIARRFDQPINRLSATASYFPPDFLTLGKDNLEVTLGVQVNSFAGPYSNVKSAGVGPVFGLAMMPMQNVELTLIKGTVDNRSRFDIQSGIRFFFGKSMPGLSPANSPSLLELRRKYMEASPYPVSSYTKCCGFRGFRILDTAGKR
jgi:hypothetical protein